MDTPAGKVIGDKVYRKVALMDFYAVKAGDRITWGSQEVAGVVTEVTPRGFRFDPDSFIKLSTGASHLSTLQEVSHSYATDLARITIESLAPVAPLVPSKLIKMTNGEEVILEPLSGIKFVEVGDWVTWGNRSRAYKVTKKGEYSLYFDKGAARNMVSGDLIKPSSMSAVQSKLPNLHRVVIVPPYTSASPAPTSGSSDGSSTDYYRLPEGAKDLLDLIDHRDMSFSVGNIFKACYRLGRKDGIDEAYDLNKIVFFAKRRLKKLKKRKAKATA